MNAILFVMIPIFFLVGFQAGRNQEFEITKEIREEMKKSWLQDCNFNKERGLK